MPAVPTHLRPPGAARLPVYSRSFASPTEAYTLDKLLNMKRSPFVKDGKASGDINELNRRLAISTITGMADAAAKQAQLPGGHVPIELRPEDPAESTGTQAYMWGSGKPGAAPNDYGIVMRPGYFGAPRGLDATVRHEIAHAMDAINHPLPAQSTAHGPTFRKSEAGQYVPYLNLLPRYGGTDYTGKDEYAQDYAEVPGGKAYQDHVYLSDYDDPRVRPYKVSTDDLKKKIAKSNKAYVQHLKNPPAPRLRLGPAARGL